MRASGVRVCERGRARAQVAAAGEQRRACCSGSRRAACSATGVAVHSTGRDGELVGTAHSAGCRCRLAVACGDSSEGEVRARALRQRGIRQRLDVVRTVSTLRVDYWRICTCPS